MAVVGRLTTLLVVISGTAFLFVDDPIPAWFPSSIEVMAGSAGQLGSSLPDIVLYGIGITAAVSLLVAYKLVSAPPARRGRPTHRAISTGTSTNPTTSTAVSSTNSDQPSKVNEASNENTKPPQEVRQDPSDISSPVTDRQPSTTLEESQQLPTQTQEIQRTTTRIRTQNPVQRPARTTRGYRTAPQRQTPASESNTPYFKPVEYDRSIRFADVDTRFSYLDVDMGPSFFQFDPIPDLVEIKFGPSAVSYDLVRSPIEIKISSLLKTLLAPTPHSAGVATRNENTQSRKTESKHSRRQPSDTRRSRNLNPRYPREPVDREQPQRRHRTLEPVDRVQAEKQSNRTPTQQPDQELMDHGNSSLDTSHSASWNYDKPADRGFGHSLFPERELEPIGEPFSTPDVGPIDEPVFDPVQDERWEEGTQANVDQEYSMSQGEPLQWEATDPFGLNDFEQEFSEPDEPLVGSSEPASTFFNDQDSFNVGEFDSVHDISMLEPSVDPGMAEEMLGLNSFEEIPDDQVGLPGVSNVAESNSLFPDSEGIFPGEFVEDDCLSF